MKTLTVKTGVQYNIHIMSGLLDRCGEIIAEISSAERAAIVTDSCVAPLYLERVSASLKKIGFEVCSFVFSAGEKSKGIGTVTEILDFLAENSLTRGDIVIALGGGVTGDMAGFAASIYMRGIDFVQIPTSLLAQIDSSVGGKTGVNIPAGKNLCGAFHQPRAVIIDPDVLATLPARFFSDGMAEAIKYGCIKDADLFLKIAQKNIPLEELIYRCVDIKRQVVEADEKEKGERMLLNFGHTAGHALEKYYNYSRLSHGEAIGIGMVKIALAGEKAGLTEKGAAEKIKSALKAYNLPISDEAKNEELLPAILSDKKRGGNHINTVLLSRIGESFTKKIHKDDMLSFLELGEAAE